MDTRTETATGTDNGSIGPVEADFDGDDGLLVALLDCLEAANCGVGPDIDPLHSYVDTDALARLVCSPESPCAALSVDFPVEEYDVTVTSDGHLEVVARAGVSLSDD